MPACPNCGTETYAGRMFCRACGVKLNFGESSVAVLERPSDGVSAEAGTGKPQGRGSGVVFGAVLLAVALIAFVMLRGGGEGGPAATKLVTSDDSRTLLRVPSDWTTDTRTLGRDKPEVSASSPSEDTNLIIFRTSNVDIRGISLKRLSAFAGKEVLKDFPGGKRLAGPRSVRISGHRAVRFEYRVLMDNVRVHMIYTLAALPDAYIEVFAGTLPSKLKTDKPILEEIMKSVVVHERL